MIVTLKRTNMLLQIVTKKRTTFLRQFRREENKMQFIGDNPRAATEICLKMRDIYKIIHDRIKLLDGNFDPDAVCQRVCVEIEKEMGIYPNTPSMTVSDAPKQQRPDNTVARQAFIDAVERGRADFAMGVVITQCPYAVSWNMNAWEYGWTDAWLARQDERGVDISALG